jgi:hypothetical protein
MRAEAMVSLPAHQCRATSIWKVRNPAQAANHMLTAIIFSWTLIIYQAINEQKLHLLNIIEMKINIVIN